MEPSIPDAEWEMLVRRTGIPMTPAQSASVREGYGLMTVLLETIRTPRGREAEPAHVFVAGPRGAAS